MIIATNEFSELRIIQNKKIQDHRGSFVKTFHHDDFQKLGLKTQFKESFYSISNKNVLRGMHFQIPPHHHAKLVYVSSGEILDVVLDMRKNSETFGKSFSITLSDTNAISLYIPEGFAHGFLTLSDSATVTYLTTTTHSPAHDSGIHWKSFGFEWPTDTPIISQRDNNLPEFHKRNSLF